MKTTLRPGAYTVTIMGPTGVILSLRTDIAERGVFELLLDDQYLPELLVLNSMPQGIIENELHEQMRASADKEGGAV